VSCRRLMHRAGRALIALVLTSAISEAQDLRHPVDAFIVRPAHPVIRASLRGAPPRDAAEAPLRQWLLALAQQRVVARIGRENGDDGHLLGEVYDVRFSADGLLVVLDQKFGVVQVYSPSGEHLRTIGRPGPGPGEFLHARALHVVDSTRVLVSDVGRRLHDFELGRSEARLRGSRQLTFVAEAACSLDRSLLLHARPTAVPHVFFLLNDSLRVQKSFGEVYRSPTRAVDAEILRGRVACASRESTLLYAPSSVLGELRAFDSKGTPRWTVVISDFTPIEMTERLGERRSVTVRVPESGYHRLHRLNYHPSGHFIAQYAFTTRADAIARKDYTRLYTLQIRAMDGRVSSLGEGVLPIAAISPSGAVAVSQNDPFPSVTVFQPSASK
jgi:hypothetical protein